MIQDKIIFNECGEKIFVETYVPDEVKSTFVFCHGITGCRKGRTKDDSYFQDLAKKLMELNYKVVLFDFSGHGDSEGNDYDVVLSKSTKELEKVFFQEVADVRNVNFLVFSYGAAVLCNFLSQHSIVEPKKIIMFSPCLYPLKSCFLNPDSIFGKDIIKDYESGFMKEHGYAVVGAKGFRFGLPMIAECEGFSPDLYKKYADKTLVMSGRNDVILNTQYNDEFCATNGIPNIYFNASHSLYEDIANAFDTVIDFVSKTE